MSTDAASWTDSWPVAPDTTSLRTSSFARAEGLASQITICKGTPIADSTAVMPTLLGQEASESANVVKFQGMASPAGKASRASSEVLNPRASHVELLRKQVTQQVQQTSRFSTVSVPHVADVPDIDDEVHLDGFKRIFENYLDVGGDGTVNVAEIARVMGVLCADDPDTLSNIMTALEAEGEEAILNMQQCTSLLFKAKERGWRGKCALIIVQLLLPFFYSVCTRLPFITVALEVIKRNGELSDVAYVLGVYQTCRAFANFLISQLSFVQPVLLYAAMTLMGLAGWTINYFMASGGIWVMFTLGLVGLSESVVCLQQGLLAETAADSASGIPSGRVLTIRMRCQYTAVSFGSCFAYIVGGWMYNSESGFEKVCLLGVSLEALGLAFVVMYFVVSAGDAFLLETEGTVHFRKLVVKLTAIDELIRAVLNAGPSRHDLKEVMPVAVKSAVYLEALRELFGAFLGWEPAPRQRRFTTMRFTRRSTRQQSARKSELRASSVENKLTFVTSNFTIDQDALKEKLRPLMKLNLHAAKFQTCELEMLLERAVQLLDRTGKKRVSVSDFLVCVLPRVQIALNPGAIFQVDTVFWYLYLVVVTQAVMALCIGTFLSTALLMYREHGMESDKMGLLLGTGEGLGCMVIAITSSSYMRNLLVDEAEEEEEQCYTKECLNVLLSRPLHVPVVLLVIGMATMLFSLPPTGAAIAAQMVALACNDLSVTLLNELTATSAPPQYFQRLQSCGQWLRRLGNMLTAFTGPMLFGVAPWLPWTVYGGVVLVWALLLWAVLVVRAREISPERDNRGIISVFKPFVMNGRKSAWNMYERAHLSTKKVASEHENLLKLMDIDVEQRLMQTDLQIQQLSRRVVAQQKSLETLQQLRKDVEVLKIQVSPSTYTTI